MATVDSIDAFTLLHAMAPMSFDASRLIDMACIAFAGLTMDQIQALRKAYRTTVVASKLNVRCAVANLPSPDKSNFGSGAMWSQNMQCWNAR